MTAEETDESTCEATEKPKRKRKPGQPRRGHVRRRVAEYLVTNDQELYAKGVTMISIAESCEVCVPTVRTAWEELASTNLTGYWTPRRWRRVNNAPLSLAPRQWTRIVLRLVENRDRLADKSPDFAARWLSLNRNCAGLTSATVAQAGRLVGYTW